MAILQKLHHGLSSSSDTQDDINTELCQIQEQNALDRDPTSNIFLLLRNKRYRKRLFIGFLLQCMTQTTGILVINNYMVLILIYQGRSQANGAQVILLAPLGVIGWKPLLLNAILNTWCSLLNLVNAFFVDRFGRIKTMIFGIVSLFIHKLQLCKLIHPVWWRLFAVRCRGFDSALRWCEQY